MSPFVKKHFSLVAASIFVAIGGILFLASMDDPPGPPRPKPIRPSGFTATMLEDNQSPPAQLFIKTCAQCHDLPDPKSHTKEEWPEIVHRMINQLRRRRFFSGKSMFVPGEKNIDQIITFLTRG